MKVAKGDMDVTQDDVWREHLEDVHVGRHWAYLGTVLLGALLLMIGLIALLGAGPR